MAELLIPGLGVVASLTGDVLFPGGGIVSGTLSAGGDASASGGTGTVTITGTGGEATGGSSGTNAAADGGTGTIAITGSGGEATGVVTGSFVSDAMENNTGAGPLASTAVAWTLYYGQIGADPSQLVHGAGTTNSSGILSGAGVPSGSADLWVKTPDGTGVFYQRITIA